jgi:hypothetical protein
MDNVGCFRSHPVRSLLGQYVSHRSALHDDDWVAHLEELIPETAQATDPRSTCFTVRRLPSFDPVLGNGVPVGEKKKNVAGGWSSGCSAPLEREAPDSSPPLTNARAPFRTFRNASNPSHNATDVVAEAIDATRTSWSPAQPRRERANDSPRPIPEPMQPNPLTGRRSSDPTLTTDSCFVASSTFDSRQQRPRRSGLRDIGSMDRGRNRAGGTGSQRRGSRSARSM